MNANAPSVSNQQMYYIKLAARVVFEMLRYLAN
jgi:hypothetical protein